MPGFPITVTPDGLEELKVDIPLDSEPPPPLQAICDETVVVLGWKSGHPGTCLRHEIKTYA